MWLEKQSGMQTHRVTNDSGNSRDDRHFKERPFGNNTILSEYSGACVEVDEE